MVLVLVLVVVMVIVVLVELVVVTHKRRVTVPLRVSMTTGGYRRRVRPGCCLRRSRRPPA
jgi:hypothetical protein